MEIRLEGISKSYGSNVALDDVSLRISSGEILCLLGENGAGKSTLMKIAAGVEHADRGRLLIDGAERPLGLDTAASAGIVMTQQHFVLVPEFTAEENLVLASVGDERLLSRSRSRNIAQSMIETSGIAFQRLDARVADLSVGEKAKLELIKVLSRQPRLLILDEPTSVLAPPEVEELKRVVRRAAEGGAAVVFITHKLPEIVDLATRVVLLRRGRMVREMSGTQISADTLASEMVDTIATPPVQRRDDAGTEALQLRSVSTIAGTHETPLNALTVSVKRGEIVSIVGVAGNGQSELARLLRGVSRASSGEIAIDGEVMTPRSLATAFDIGHVPADRTELGLVHELSVADNLALIGGQPFSTRREVGRRVIDDFSVRAENEQMRAGALSGGNQQKVILARELGRRPRVLILAEPTRGLDLASTAFVHSTIRDAAANGAAILLITSDLDEALSLSDALHVIYRGSLSERLSVNTSSDVIGRRMAGVA